MTSTAVFFFKETALPASTIVSLKKETALYYISRCRVQFFSWRDSHPEQVCTKRAQPGKWIDSPENRIVLFNGAVLSRQKSLRRPLSTRLDWKKCPLKFFITFLVNRALNWSQIEIRQVGLWNSLLGKKSISRILQRILDHRQQPSPLLYRIDIWPACNSRLTQRETNHYITSSLRKRVSLALPCWKLARTISYRPFFACCMLSISGHN